MNKVIPTFLLLFFTVVISLNSQTLLSSFEIKLKFPNQIEPLVVVDSKNNVHFFYVSDNMITHVNHDVKKETYSRKIYSRPNNTFPRLQGFSITNEDNINLFFSNYSDDGILLMSIKKNSDKIYAKQFELKFEKKERFLKAVNHNQKFHMLTYVKGTSIIKRYTFNKEGSATTVYDLNREIFYNSYNKEISLSKILAANDDCSIIEENIPLSIEISSKKTKIYPSKNELLISSNHKLEGTRIIRLSLDDNYFQSTFHKAFPKSLENNIVKKSNSFILKNKLYHLSASKDTLIFTVDNLLNKERIKTISLGKKGAINFKNGPIYEQGAVANFSLSNKSIGSRKIISSTKEFLRKLSNSEVGIQVYNKENISDITIGGVKEIQGNGASTATSFPVLVNGLAGPIEIMYHTTMPASYSYNSYINSRSVFLKSLLNKNSLEHIDGDAPNLITNVFDKISMRSRYLKNSVLKKKLAIETIFKMNNFFVYGYYNTKEKTYTLVKFN